MTAGLPSSRQAPASCLYCDGTDPNCGFCEMGKPLDTQADWDASWGRIAAYVEDVRQCQEDKWESTS